MSNQVDERRCSQCNIIQPIDQYTKCKRSIGGRKQYCKSCARNTKQAHKKAHPIESKIRQDAENLIKRLTTDINKPSNKCYKEKDIQCKIGCNSAEIYKYLISNFYNDYKVLMGNNQTPSIDRINSNGHYEHGNIRIIPFEENSKGGRVTSKKVCSKSVRITFEDGLSYEYNSISDASKLSGISRHVLQNVLLGKTKIPKSYKVEYI